MDKAVGTALAIAAAALAGCGEARSQESGPAAERSFPVGSFDGIEVAGPYDVEVRTGAQPSVRARGSEAALDRLEVRVSGSRLEIRPRREGSWWGWDSKNVEKASLLVTVPALRSASIAGSGDIRIDRVRGERFEGDIAGSGDMTLGAVEVADLKLAIAGAGDTRAGHGRARTVEIDIAGSGDVDARQIASEEVKVSIAGAGTVAAHATRAADVSIMGSGDVELTGGAKCKVSKMGAGEVRCS